MDAPFTDYTLLDHTADLAVKVQGGDPKSVFENAAKALMHLMIRGKPSGNVATRTFSLKGQDLADLLVRWLGEVLYLLEGEHMVTTSVAVECLTSQHLKAVVEAVPFDPEKHEILSEVKAVTYHQIEVAEEDDHWEATFVLDI